MELKNIALFFNSKRESCSKAAKELKSRFEKEQIKTKILPYDNFKINQNFDLIFSLGGDGSLLKIVRKTAHRKIKILGLNFGHLGFLTYDKQVNMKELLKALKADKFCLQERALIDVQVIRNKKIVFEGIALNECTIKSNKARAIHLNTFYEKSELKEYFADGINEYAKRLSRFCDFSIVETEEENDRFEAASRGVFNGHHQAAPDDDRTLYFRNRLITSQQMDRVTNILRTALWILGLFTLLSGVVGVSNIMLITVKERTHEFGIRKAIGASPASLLKLVITEAVVITAFFGSIGMFLGMIANQILDKTLGDTPIEAGIVKITMFVNPTVGLDVALQATLLLIVAGTLAGLIPAWKASKVKPIETLRAE